MLSGSTRHSGPLICQHFAVTIFILQTKQVIFQPNLKYLHVQFTVSVVTEMAVPIFEVVTEKCSECDRKETKYSKC